MVGWEDNNLHGSRIATRSEALSVQPGPASGTHGHHFVLATGAVLGAELPVLQENLSHWCLNVMS